MAQAARASSRINALTGLRFFAAFWVVLHHYGYFVAYPLALRYIADEGNAGVSLFFILSGFVLVYTYHDWFAQSLNRYGDFLKARFARIYPVYLLALVLATPITLAFPHAYLISAPSTRLTSMAASWLANLLLLHAWLPSVELQIWNVPSWSLSVELVFYFTLPLFLRFVLVRRRQARALLTLAFALYAAQILLYGLSVIVLRRFAPSGTFTKYLDNFVYLSPLLRVWEFFLGCTLGALFLAGRQRLGSAGLTQWLGKEHRRNLAIVTAVASGIVGVAAVRIVFGDGEIARSLHWYVLYTPPFVILIAALACGRTFLSRVLEHPVLVLLGEASYALYILHWLPLVLLSRNLVGLNGYRLEPWLAIASMALTVAASIGVYRVVEVPARRRLRAHPWRWRTRGRPVKHIFPQATNSKP